MTARWSWIAAAGLGLALAACGGGDTDAPAGEAPGAEQTAAEQTTQVAVACAPQSEVEGRASPYDSTTVTVGDGAAKVCYSRPSLRGRTMIGGEAVPYGQLWRMGANEPTTVHVSVPTSIAGIAVEPGSYSLYTIPREGDRWTLIVNAATSQWGHESSYTEEVAAREVGRADVEVQTLDSPVEQLTIRAMDDGSGLVLEWQRSRILIPMAPA